MLANLPEHIGFDTVLIVDHLGLDQPSACSLNWQLVERLPLKAGGPRFSTQTRTFLQLRRFCEKLIT